MFHLHVVPSHGEPFGYLLEGAELSMGRSSKSGLVIDDEVVSRKHARLFRDGHAWFIEDLKSHNGTWLNGKKVERPMVIGLGDVIRLSGTIITVQPAPDKNKKKGPRAQAADEREIFKSVSELLSKSIPGQEALEKSPAPLRRQTEYLKLLNEIHSDLGKYINREELLDRILDRVFRHLKPEEGTIYLIGEEDTPVQVARRPDIYPEDFMLYSRSLVDQVLKGGMAALVYDARFDERFSAAESIVASGVRSLLAAPIMDAQGTLGMIVLASTTVARKFAEEDMEVLVSIASAAALRLRNMILVEQTACQLRDANRLLEEKVAERTSELEARNLEIIKQQKQLIVKEKMASLGTLTGGIAHEIRNPLNFINNFADISIELLGEIRTAISSEENRLDPDLYKNITANLTDLEENAEFIIQHGVRANQIVQSMIEFAVEETGKFQESEINTLVREYVRLAYKGMQAKKTGMNINLIEEYGPDIGYATMAPHNIGRVLINLMNNAVESVLEKKKTADGAYQPTIRVETARVEEKLEILVADNGIGIDEKDTDHLFTPFFTTKPAGGGNIGLGLSIVFDIVVNEHQGEIKLDRDGDQTIFRVLLPVEPSLPDTEPVEMDEGYTESLKPDHVNAEK